MNYEDNSELPAYFGLVFDLVARVLYVTIDTDNIDHAASGNLALRATFDKITSVSDQILIPYELVDYC